MRIKKATVFVLALSILLSLTIALAASATTPDPSPPDSVTIIVHKFHDANKNGVQDLGEMDIEGWLIRVYGSGELLAEGLTGPDGTVTFSGLPAGLLYKVWEEARDCWEPTAPPLGSDFYAWRGGYRYVIGYLYAGASATVEFGNVYTCEPPPGDEGCTPGYWKNHLDSWPPTGYSPNDDDFDTVFGVDLFDPDITLNDAIRAKGGGDNRLARHGTAALLSAAHPGVDYGLSVAEVITLVQAGDEHAGDTLEYYNELGCPLN